MCARNWSSHYPIWNLESAFNAITVAVRYFRSRVHGTTQSSYQAKLLVSIIIYATPVNLTNLPGFCECH
ncbi:unnamed protein product [Toxocara canis]|uniref:Transposase n=1 Tax=Toxocara canis TaxID=6265 RepID=A0A183UKB2_TOXCA|nr:unnamed protein product [Toxocara canis]